MGTILAAPEASYESVCCSEEVLQELTLYGWMASTNLYPRISIQVTLSRPETYPDGTVRVTAGLKTALKSCRDISRTSFTSDANLESIDFSEEHRLTLSGAGENWTVAWDAFSSDFGRMESGYATNHRDDAFCAEPIRSYFSLRANALDGDYVAGNPEFCIGALRSDAFDFAQALLKDRPEILRVYRAESRAVNLGQFRRIDGDAATQVPVDECIRDPPHHYHLPPGRQRPGPGGGRSVQAVWPRVQHCGVPGAALVRLTRLYHLTENQHL